MDIKPRPNDARYIEVLRRMSSEARLTKAIELSELSKSLFRAGLKRRFPDTSESELHRLYLERLEQCRKRAC